MAMASPKQELAFFLMQQWVKGVAKAIGINCDKSDCAILLLTGGNQSGKSFAGSLGFAKIIRDHAPDGSIFWAIAPNMEKSIGTQQRYLWQHLPKAYIEGAGWNEKTGFGSKNPMLIYDDGKKRVVIKFKTQAQYEENPDSFESETLHGMWIDESISKKCYDACQPRVAVRGGFILVTTIPSADWMYYALSNAEKSAKVLQILMLPKDNPGMSPEAYERLKASITDPIEYAMRIEGKFQLFDKLVFPYFSREKHIIEEDQAPKAMDCMLHAGMDIGMDHPTVWLLIGIKGTKIYCFEEYSARHTTIEQDSVEILDRQKHYKFKKTTMVDPAAFRWAKGMSAPPAIQYMRNGVRLAPAPATSSYGEASIVKTMREMVRNDEIYIIKNKCPLLEQNFYTWSYRRTRDGVPMGNGSPFEDKNNDGIDALKYILASMLNWKDHNEKENDIELQGYSL